MTAWVTMFTCMVLDCLAGTSEACSLPCLLDCITFKLQTSMECTTFSYAGYSQYMYESNSFRIYYLYS